MTTTDLNLKVSGRSPHLGQLLAAVCGGERKGESLLQNVHQVALKTGNIVKRVKLERKFHIM